MEGVVEASASSNNTGGGQLHRAAATTLHGEINVASKRKGLRAAETNNGIINIRMILTFPGSRMGLGATAFRPRSKKSKRFLGRCLRS